MDDRFSIILKTAFQEARLSGNTIRRVSVTRCDPNHFDDFFHVDVELEPCEFTFPLEYPYLHFTHVRSISVDCEVYDE